MKTEKRPAKVGERILITNPKITTSYYQKGDILTAGEWDEKYKHLLIPGDVLTKEFPDRGYLGEEAYEVIVGEETEV